MRLILMLRMLFIGLIGRFFEFIYIFAVSTCLWLISDENCMYFSY
jgi:hypothetical protein